MSSGTSTSGLYAPSLLAPPAQTSASATAIVSLVSGATAGTVAKTLIAPLDRIKLLFQTSHPDFVGLSLPQALSKVYSENGAMGLFRGHSATVARIVPYAGIKFAVYESLTTRWKTRQKGSHKFLPFLSGAASGLSAVLATYPLELIRVRLAYPSAKHGTSYSNIIKGILKASDRSSPIFSFYRGFFLTLVGMVPYAGTSFLVYESTFPFTHSSLVSGAVAGALGQTASYPIEVLRRRLQVAQEGTVLSLAKDINSRFGWRGFYRGLLIGYIKVVPMTAISFTVYEHSKRFLNKHIALVL